VEQVNVTEVGHLLAGRSQANDRGPDVVTAEQAEGVGRPAREEAIPARDRGVAQSERDLRRVTVREEAADEVVPRGGRTSELERCRASISRTRPALPRISATTSRLDRPTVAPACQARPKHAAALRRYCAP
jgi:hypothetical protein